MDGFQLPLCAQLRQALCLLGIGANIWDKCNLPPAIRYPLLGRNSKSSIAAKSTAEQGLFHRKILVNRSRPPSTAQTVSPPYRSHPFFNSSYKTLDATRQQYMRELENKDKQYRDILTDKNRWLRRMFFCLIGMLAVISFLLIVDFINPTIGVFHP